MNSQGGILKTVVILFLFLYILQCVVDAFAPCNTKKTSVLPTTSLNFPSRTITSSSDTNVKNKRNGRDRECTTVNLIDDTNDGASNKGSDAKKRIVSTDEIGSLFSSAGTTGSSQSKPSLASDGGQEDDYDGDEYDYDYNDDDEEETEQVEKLAGAEKDEILNNVDGSSLMKASTSKEKSESPSAPLVTMMDNDQQNEDEKNDNKVDEFSVERKETIDLVSDSDGLKFSSSSSPNNLDSNTIIDEDNNGYRSQADKKYFLDLIDLEKAYADSRTAPEDEMVKEIESGDLDIENNIIVDPEDVEYVWETGMEYIDMERVLEKRQRRSMLDSMSITNKDGKISQRSDVRNIPQYDPTEVEPPNRMAYGAYRRWKLAEIEENDKANGKGRKDNKKKMKPGSGNRDSFFNSIKNLGQGDKGQGFGSRAEPPPNMKPVVPSKPVPKKNRKRVITPDSIDNLFSKPEPVDPEIAAAEESEEDDEYEDEYEDVELEESSENIKTATATDSSSTTMMVDFDTTQNDDNESITNQRDKPINLKSLVDEEPPKWLVDADKAAKAERRMKKKKKKPLTKDWRFWAALIASVGLLSSAFNVYQQTGGSIGPVPSPTELII